MCLVLSLLDVRHRELTPEDYEQLDLGAYFRRLYKIEVQPRGVNKPALCDSLQNLRRLPRKLCKLDEAVPNRNTLDEGETRGVLPHAHGRTDQT